MCGNWGPGSRGGEELVINYLDYDRARCSALLLTQIQEKEDGEKSFSVLIAKKSVPENPSFD